MSPAQSDQNVLFFHTIGRMLLADVVSFPRSVQALIAADAQLDLAAAVDAAAAVQPIEVSAHDQHRRSKGYSVQMLGAHIILTPLLQQSGFTVPSFWCRCRQRAGRRCWSSSSAGWSSCLQMAACRWAGMVIGVRVNGMVPYDPEPFSRLKFACHRKYVECR